MVDERRVFLGQADRPFFGLQPSRSCTQNGRRLLQRSKSALGALYRRQARQEGAAFAVVATVRRLAVLIFRMLRNGHDYIDEGEKAYERRFETRCLPGLTSAATALGFTLVKEASSG